MARNGINVKTKKSTRRGRRSTSGGTRRKRKSASDAGGARSPVGPSSAVPQFQQAFDEYWKVIQAYQTAVILQSQRAYATFLKSLEESWDESGAKKLFTAVCRKFAETISTASEINDAGSSVEDAYQRYVEEVRNIWEEPSLMQSLEQASLALTEESQKAVDEARIASESAQKRYLAMLSEIWKQLDLDQLDPNLWATVSRNMMVTVFFTQGMRVGEPNPSATFSDNLFVASDPASQS